MATSTNARPTASALSDFDKWLAKSKAQLDDFRRWAAEYRRKEAERRRSNERAHIDGKRRELQHQERMAAIRGTKTTECRLAQLEMIRQQQIDEGRDLHDRAPQFRAFFSEIRRRLDLDVRYDVLPGANNATAWPLLKKVELQRIIDEDTLATALHEAGHCTVECKPPRHQRVATDPNFPAFTQVCLQCELGAWRQAIEWVAQDGWRPKYGRIVWNYRMHAHMTEAIRTYEKYATPAERDEINRLTSARTRLDAVARALELESKGR